jgi:hypothetical protein
MFQRRKSSAGGAGLEQAGIERAVPVPNEKPVTVPAAPRLYCCGGCGFNGAANDDRLYNFAQQVCPTTLDPRIISPITRASRSAGSTARSRRQKALSLVDLYQPRRTADRGVQLMGFTDTLDEATVIQGNFEAPIAAGTVKFPLAAASTAHLDS